MYATIEIINDGEVVDCHVFDSLADATNHAVMVAEQNTDATRERITDALTHALTFAVTDYRVTVVGVTE